MKKKWHKLLSFASMEDVLVQLSSLLRINVIFISSEEKKKVVLEYPPWRHMWEKSLCHFFDEVDMVVISKFFCEFLAPNISLFY